MCLTPSRVPCHDMGGKSYESQNSLAAYDQWLESKGGWRMLPQSTESARMSRLGGFGVHSSIMLSERLVE
jgi:hypothetical protein